MRRVVAKVEFHFGNCSLANESAALAEHDGVQLGEPVATGGGGDGVDGGDGHSEIRVTRA